MTQNLNPYLVKTTLEGIGHEAHRIAKEHGFWELDEDGNAVLESRNFGEMIALMHSELSEALEAH